MPASIDALESVPFPLPPAEFMAAVAGKPVTIAEHIMVGEHVFSVVREHCNVIPQDDVLDIGSGCGRVASHFLNYTTGRYIGLDVVEPMVQWCQEHLSPLRRNFEFVHADISNTHYSQDGASAAEYEFPFASASFDVVFATSVFTHLLPSSAAQYAREIARVLKPGGRALLTFMLINDDLRARTFDGHPPDTRLPYRRGGCYLLMPDNPEAVVGFEQEDAEALIKATGLLVEDISIGSWTGVPGGWSYQDCILVNKPAGTRS